MPLLVVDAMQQPADAEDGGMQLEAEYQSVINAGMAEADRRLRLERLVAQERAEDDVPLLERQCVICMESLQDDEEGPPIRLPCNPLHYLMV